MTGHEGEMRVGRWRAFGKVLGDHMAPLTLGVVAFGILFPQTLAPVRPWVPLLFGVLTYQGALGNTFANLVQVVRHPRLLVTILVASSCVIPTLARLFAGPLFGGDPDLLTGVVLEYCVPVAVLSVMWSSMSGGNTALTLSCVFVSTVLAPVTLPLMMQVLLGAKVQVDVMGMARTSALMIALPALLGIGTNDLTRGWGARELSPTMAPATRLMALLIIGTNSTSISEYMLNLTPQLVGVIGVIFVLSVAGYFLGIWLGRTLGDGQPDVVSTCLCCGMRNISSGAVIAAQYFPPATMFPVIAGTLFQQVLAATFGRRLAPRDDDGTA